jgi:hypothetical protein
MTEDSMLKECIERLKKSIIKVQRITALMNMSKQDNPYLPLIRVMSRLELIQDWPVL